MTAKFYISAERVSREDEFEHYLQIAKDRNLGIEIQEFYLPDLMWGNWKQRLDKWGIAPTMATKIYGEGIEESIDYLQDRMASSAGYGKHQT
jgi:hypothetical protein